MPEWYWAVLVPVGWIFWAAGGSGWPPFRKGWRRYIWPIILGGALWASGTCPVSCVLTAIFVSLSTHLGYGEGKSWHWRWWVGLSYGLALCPLLLAAPHSGVRILQFGVRSLMSAVLFVGLMFHSLKYNWFPWKLAEGATGLWQAVHAGFSASP